MDPTLVVLLMCLLAASANSIPPAEVTESISNFTNIGDSIDNEAVPIVSNNTIQLSSSAAKSLEDNLYNLIVSNKQFEAVSESISLFGSGHDSVITNVVNRLITDGQPQVMDYAIKVIEARAKYIARTCFPSEIRIHESLVFVQIINYKYRFALKYAQGVDWAGDKTAYGDASLLSRSVTTWRFVYQWHGDRVYFIVRPIIDAIFLKLGNTRDKDGDHGVYGSNNYDTDRHLWYLKPVRYDGQILFYIINKEYNELLKLGLSVDDDGDRKAYGHSSLDFNPEKFAWMLDVL